MYLTLAFLAFLYFLSERRMNNLRVCNGLDGSIPTRASNKSLMFSNVFFGSTHVRRHNLCRGQFFQHHRHNMRHRTAAVPVYGVFGQGNVSDLMTGQVFDQIFFTASNFYFTPTNNGFTVTLLNGPQLILSPVGYSAGEFAGLEYNFVVQDPTLLVTSEIVSSPGLATSGSD